MENAKNVYSKIQLVRAELVKIGLKKSGKNTYSNFTYYELGDFLPSLNKLMNEHGLMTRFVIVSGTPEKAVLEIINTDKPEEKVTFYSETANVNIGARSNGTGGAEPIQNLGGKITYMRRYLLMMAFEIADSDVVDNKRNIAPPTEVEIDEESIKKIEAVKTLEELKNVCTKIKNEKGFRYQKSIMAYYTSKKEELEGKEGGE